MAPSVDLSVRHVNDDSFIFALNWSTPFTWNGFPIISYKIIMINHSDEQPRATINTTKGNINQIEYTGRGSGCYMLSFSIEANSSLGKGESTLVHSTQPIGKIKCNHYCKYISRQYASNFQHNNCITTSAIDGIEDIEITFTLQPNGTSHFWISFLVRLFLE